MDCSLPGSSVHGFSRQEHWSGLLFPSPMHDSEKWKWSRSVVSDSLQPHGLYSPWNSPGQNTGVGSHSPLQGISPTKGSNPGLLHCRQILNQLSHKGSPRILEWVAYPFSSGSSWPRNRTGVSCITGRFFTNLAMREAHRIVCQAVVLQMQSSSYAWTEAHRPRCLTPKDQRPLLAKRPTKWGFFTLCHSSLPSSFFLLWRCPHLIPQWASHWGVMVELILPILPNLLSSSELLVLQMDTPSLTISLHSKVFPY